MRRRGCLVGTSCLAMARAAHAAAPPGRAAPAPAADRRAAADAARTLAEQAPTAELREAAQTYLALLRTREEVAARPPSPVRGNELRQLEVSERANGQEIARAARALPSRYHDGSFQCTEDFGTCGTSGKVAMFVCSGALLVCLLSRVKLR